MFLQTLCLAFKQCHLVFLPLEKRWKNVVETLEKHSRNVRGTLEKYWEKTLGDTWETHLGDTWERHLGDTLGDTLEKEVINGYVDKS